MEVEYEESKTSLHSPRGKDLYTGKEKEEALEYVEQKGFPRLKVWEMKQWTPQLLRLFIDQMDMINNRKTKFVSTADRQVLYAAVSAINGCELCMSFHAASLFKNETYGASEEDIRTIIAGGLPQEQRLRGLVTAARLALAHKGILMKREKKHLQSFGISQEMYFEILFYCSAMNAANMVMVYMVNEDCGVDDWMKEAGPFRDTVYNKQKK